MGLDMYLYLRKHDYIGSWDIDRKKEIENFYTNELSDFAKDIYERNYLSKNTLYQVGYWCKANAIHGWIVENCADGVDDCRDIYIDLDKAKELLKLCFEVLDNHELAKDLLPCTQGFFFGDDEYDEWYFEEIEYTKHLLTKIINLIEKGNDYDIIYCASW